MGFSNQDFSMFGSTDDVEVMMNVRAILFAHELGLSSIILNGDSEVEIKAFKSEDESLASFDHFLASVQSTINAF